MGFSPMRFINNIVITFLLMMLVSCGNTKRAGSVYNEPYHSDIIEQTKPQQDQDSLLSESEIMSFFSLEDGKRANLRHEMVFANDKYYAASGDLCRRFEVESTAEKKVLCVPAGEKQFKNAFIKRALR